MALITSSSGMRGAGPSVREYRSQSKIYIQEALRVLSGQLVWPCHPDTTLQHHWGQVSHLGHPGFCILFGWRGGTVSVADWRVLEDFLFSLGFYQIDSMFGKALGLLIFLLAVTFLPGFLASPLFLDYTVNSCIPPPGLFSPPVFLGRPAHIFSCLQQTGKSFSQVPSVPLPLELLEVISAMKAFLVLWVSGSLRRQVLRRGTNFFLAGGGMSARKSQTKRCCLENFSPGITLTSLTCLQKVLWKST